jgi:DNA-binding XRE family transcriptional regulator
LRLKPVIEEKAEKRMLQGKANPMQKSAQGTTRDELAKIAGVSHDTIAKVERIEEEPEETATPAQ